MLDIELLPDIASIFNISVDELLGVNESLNNNRVQKCLEEADQYYVTGETAKMIEVIKNGLKENPTKAKLSLKLIETLFSLDDDHREDTRKRIISLGTKITDKLKKIDDQCRLYQILVY